MDVVRWGGWKYSSEDGGGGIELVVTVAAARFHSQWWRLP